MSKVSEVLELAASYLGLEYSSSDDSAAAPGGEDSSGGSQPVDNEEKNDLLRCVNLVVGDMAMGPVTLVNSKVIAVSAGSAIYASIDKNLTEIVSVKTQEGEKVKFTPYSDRFLAEDGIYVVTYRYLPDKLTEDDDLPFPATVGVKAVAYGVACEYCLICGRNNEAVKWQELFLKQLERMEQNKTSKAGVIPARSWY